VRKPTNLRSLLGSTVAARCADHVAVVDGKPISTTEGPCWIPVFSLRRRVFIPQAARSASLHHLAAGTESTLCPADSTGRRDNFERVATLAWTQANPNATSGDRSGRGAPDQAPWQPDLLSDPALRALAGSAGE